MQGVTWASLGAGACQQNQGAHLCEATRSSLFSKVTCEVTWLRSPLYVLTGVRSPGLPLPGGHTQGPDVHPRTSQTSGKSAHAPGTRSHHRAKEQNTPKCI